MTRYRTIVADPPWPIKWTGGNRKAGWSSGSARVHKKRALPYQTMTVGEIAGIDVEAHADDDAHLFLWTLDRFLISGDAQRVCRVWGFEPLPQLIVWAKANAGLGRYLRSAHELILVGRRGQARFEEIAEPTVRWLQPYEGGVRLHSAKPEGSYDLIRQLSPGPYLELFARRQRLGWDTWGNQAFGHVELGDAAS